MSYHVLTYDVYSAENRARIFAQVTLYRRLRIGRDCHLDQTEAYDILQPVREYGSCFLVLFWLRLTCDLLEEVSSPGGSRTW